MSKALATSVRAASLTLTSALTTVVGTVASDAANSTTGAIAIRSLVKARVHATYTRHASSTTGRPIFAAYVSLDAPTTAPAAVANWVPVQLLDSSTFSAGRIDGYAMAVSTAPSASGATSCGTVPFDVSGAYWMRVDVADVDSVNCGALTNIVFGGECSP